MTRFDDDFMYNNDFAEAVAEPVFEPDHRKRNVSIVVALAFAAGALLAYALEKPAVPPKAPQACQTNCPKAP